VLTRHEITFSPIYSIRDVLADPHFIAREMVTSVDDSVLGPVKMHNVVPRFSATPGAIRNSGPELGAHNAEVYAEFGLDAATLASLKEQGVI